MSKLRWLAILLGITAAACSLAIRFDWICSNWSHWFNRELYCSKRLFPVKARYPGHLTQAEQVQGVVFEQLAMEQNGCWLTDREPTVFFLSSADAEEQEQRHGVERDAPAAILSYIRSAFPSTHGVSAAGPVSMERHQVTERETGRDGVILCVAPLEVSGDGPITVVGSYYANGMIAEGTEFRLQKLEGRWTIIARKRLWVS